MNYDYTYTAGNGLATGVLIVVWLLGIAWAVLAIIGLWKTFHKAGLPGWAAIIPFYNEYNVVKMSNRPIWFFWAMLGCSLFAWIPVLGFILIIGIIVLWVFVALDIAANFGQGTGFAILLIIFPSIMFLILGFGSARYNRIAAAGSAGFGAPPMPAGGGYTAYPPQPPASPSYVAPPAPPAPPAGSAFVAPPAAAAAPVTPTAPVTPPESAATPVTPSAPVTPPVTPAEQTAATEAPAQTADAGVPEAPPAPDVPPQPPASAPPPPPPLA